MRKRGVRVRDAGNIGVAKQREDRVVIGRGGNLDLATGGRGPVFREYGVEEFVLLLFQRFLVFLGEARAFFRKFFYHGVVGQVFFVHPGELRKQLQVTPLPYAEMGDARLHSSGAHLRLQLRETRPSIDEAFVHLEGAFEGLALLVVGQ